MKPFKAICKITTSSVFLLFGVACGKMEAKLQRPEAVVFQHSSQEKELALEADAQDPVQVASSERLVGPGVLKPTIYYYAQIIEHESSCTPSFKVTLHGAGGKPLLKVCPRTEQICGEQGSCAVEQNGKSHHFNIIGRFDGQDRYFEIPKNGCRYGYGVKESCLDPFYTLAADLSIYKPGEVIYIPAIVGVELPDGSKHDGYFIIRDQGRGIEGRGRFDFFTGFFHWADSKNPFVKLGLADVKTNIPYFRVAGEKAKEILAKRSFPKLLPTAYGGQKN